MFLAPIDFHWSIELKGTPEELWPMVSNTDRFDRDTGTPKINYSKQLQSNRLPQLAAGFPTYGFRFEYTQDPFEWKCPHEFGARRSI